MSIDYVTARLTRKQAANAAEAIAWLAYVAENEDVLIPVWVQRGIFDSRRALITAVEQGVQP